MLAAVRPGRARCLADLPGVKMRYTVISVTLFSNTLTRNEAVSGATNGYRVFPCHLESVPRPVEPDGSGRNGRETENRRVVAL